MVEQKSKSWFSSLLSLPVILCILGLLYSVHVAQNFYQIMYPPTAVYTDTTDKNLLSCPYEDGEELLLKVWATTVQNPRVNGPIVMWQTKVKYGMDQETIKHQVNLTVPTEAFAIRAGPSLFVWVDVENKKGIHSFQPRPFGLVEHMEEREEHSLLKEEAREESQQKQRVAHFKKRVGIRLVHEEAKFHRKSIPKENAPARSPASRNFLVPIAFVDEMWITRDDFVSLRPTIEDSQTKQEKQVTFPIEVEFSPLGAPTYRLQSTMQRAISQQTQMMGGSEKEMEEVRLMFVENSPLVLLVTVVVALFHLIFEFLSLKNDVSFWRAQKSLEGVSLGSLTMQSVSKFIILLYLKDESTNVLVMVGLVLDFFVSVWKVQSAVTVSVSLLFPFVRATAKNSYRQGTGGHDMFAVRQLGKLLVPLMLAYLGYSLVYEKHRSWYSFVISWLAGCVYAFGFVLMTPQLFLNYKLKSVAHLPWRAMVYRFINTFIDDLFAFIIKMPTMHRVSVLRDDIVFFVYLYQRWIYPVDAARVCDLDDTNNTNDTDKKEQ